MFFYFPYFHFFLNSIKFQEWKIIINKLKKIYMQFIVVLKNAENCNKNDKFSFFYCPYS